MDFPGSEPLVRQAGPMASRPAALKARAGIAGNICVLFSANDAYMRDLRLYVPRDCTVSNTLEDNDYALRQMQTVLKADIRRSEELDLADLARNGGARPASATISGENP
jgi:hypothetical protein